MYVILKSACLLALATVAHCQQQQQPQQPQQRGQPNQPLYQVVANQDNYTIFQKLVDNAQLSSVLNTTSPITVFAPSDQAFQQLPPVLVQALQLPQLAPLTKMILQYHIATGNISVAQLPVGKPFIANSLLDGMNLYLLRNRTSGRVMVNNEATIIAEDVQASNGAIQGIDRVLTPAFSLVNFTAPIVITPGRDVPFV